MRCPALLPNHLRVCETFLNEDALYDYLVADAKTLLSFLVTAVQDETWTSTHLSFIKSLIQWITIAFFQGSIDRESLIPLVVAIREHQSFLRPYLLDPELDPPLAVECHLEHGTAPLSMLLAGFSSPRWKDLLTRNCFRTQTFSLNIPDLTQTEFSYFQEFWFTGSNEALWREEVVNLVHMMERGAEWEMQKFVESVTKVVERYLSKTTVVSMLLEAHQKKLLVWKQACYDFITEKISGLICPKEASAHLSLRFEAITEETRTVFHALSSKITQLGFAGNLPEYPIFLQLIAQCPRLTSLDLSGTELSHLEQLSDLPQVKEVDLSGCPWLNDELFSEVINRMPHIESLKVGGDVLLTYRSWGELIHLKRLHSLSVRGCYQIDDDDALAILCSIPEIRELSLFGCQNVGDRSLRELPRHCPKLESLDLTGCGGVTDETVSEIAYSSLALRELSLSKCRQITQKGIETLIREQKDLQSLNL